MHRRAAIRQAFAARVADLATTGARVSTGLVYPVSTDAMPHLDVTTTGEEIIAEGASMGAPIYPQERALEIQATASASGDGYLDTLDQVALEVEVAIMSEPTLGGLAKFVELASSTMEPTAEVEVPAGVLEMIWNARYTVNANNPE